ncbi:hypothetical protein GXW82_08685 [Streptacidiphilus sp. 4-A2]|nr:hypothetical protein [Streptacidiphilus sp. 4-A2]
MSGEPVIRIGSGIVLGVSTAVRAILSRSDSVTSWPISSAHCPVATGRPGSRRCGP